MDKTDVVKLFSLLEILHPSGKKPTGNPAITAWAMVLAPYDYEAVKAAAVKRARGNRFFPDPAEIIEFVAEDKPQGGDSDRYAAPAWYKRFMPMYREEILKALGRPLADGEGLIVAACEADLDLMGIYKRCYFAAKYGDRG